MRSNDLVKSISVTVATPEFSVQKWAIATGKFNSKEYMGFPPGNLRFMGVTGNLNEPDEKYGYVQYTGLYTASFRVEKMTRFSPPWTTVTDDSRRFDFNDLFPSTDGLQDEPQVPEVTPEDVISAPDQGIQS